MYQSTYASFLSNLHHGNHGVSNNRPAPAYIPPAPTANPATTNNTQAGGGMGFAFGFQSAATQVQQAPMNQVQQLGQLLQTAFQSFFKAAGQFAQMQQGAGFAQSPANCAGFVPAPSPQMMNPMNPSFAQQAGAFQQAGGQIGGMQAGGMMQGGGMMQAGGMQAGGGFFGGFISFGGGMRGNTGVAQIPEISPQKPPTGIKELGPNKFKTPGGFTVEAMGKSNGWKVTSPDGSVSEITGDPHVKNMDKNGKVLKSGGRFDFKKPTSLVLGDGTKITVEVTPPLSNGHTVTKNIHIQSGSQRVSISGIDKNQPKSSGIKNDRYAFDAKLADGDHIALSAKDGAWLLNGKSRIVGHTNAGANFVVDSKVGRGELTAAAAANMKEVSLPQANQPGLRPPQANQPGFRPPRFGGQMFGLQVMMQIFQQMMSRMQGQGQGLPGIRMY